MNIKTATATAIARLGDTLRDNNLTPDTNALDALGEWLVAIAYEIDGDAASAA
jgi:hypothetical protein